MMDMGGRGIGQARTPWLETECLKLMNLNEECLLLFLQGTRPLSSTENHPPAEAAPLTTTEGAPARGGYASPPKNGPHANPS